MKNNHARFILIGHSNGGLVSRYYIENMGGDVNVEKLITIDTPHYGSGLGDLSTVLFELGITVLPGNQAVPLDIELRPNSSLFTGDELDLNNWVTNIANPVFEGALYLVNGFLGLAFTAYKIFNQDKWDKMYSYIQDNQSNKLKGNKFKGDTQYYAIGGLVACGNTDFMDELYFEFNFDPSKFSTTDDFHNKINEASTCEIDFRLISGDNVVNLYSQFGLKADGKNIIDFVQFRRTFLVVSVIPAIQAIPNMLFDQYHTGILSDNRMHSVLFECIED